LDLEDPIEESFLDALLLVLPGFFFDTFNVPLDLAILFGF
jgi:hypothetical protein